MKSSSGEHYVALDHIRALAAFLVFAWHFLHGTSGQPVPFEGAPALFPLALLDEGHTGVALFMTLSGYLFAKLLDGKKIDYAAFLRNRLWRLLPLLLLVLAIRVGVDVATGREGFIAYLETIAKGIVLPTLPNGGWSITVELHFYLLLPVFLWLARRSRWWLPTLVFAAIAVRAALYAQIGELQSLSYWTLVGRVDQFTLGIFAFHMSRHLAGRHWLALATFVAFTLGYAWFDARGGFMQMPDYPSPSRLWIVIPTFEALAYAVLIAWYDTSFRPKNTGISRIAGLIGAYSYSIYLLHFFFVFDASRFVHEQVMDISNFYLACIWAALCFGAMLPIGYLSFRFIESPFLRLRRRYARAA